jgi:hypothetical protein
LPLVRVAGIQDARQANYRNLKRVIRVKRINQCGYEERTLFYTLPGYYLMLVHRGLHQAQKTKT